MGDLSRLARAVLQKAPAVQVPSLSLRWAVVVSVETSTATIYISGSTTAIANIAYLERPTAGATVSVLVSGNDMLILGKPGHTGFYEEIARTTLASTGDVITVNNIPARRYLRLMVHTIQSANTVNQLLTCNNDTASNYSYVRYPEYVSPGTPATAAFIQLSRSAASQQMFTTVDIANLATAEKIVSSLSTAGGIAGAANAGSQTPTIGKWANTTDQISRIDVTNTGLGDFNIGSEVVVLGHD